MAETEVVPSPDCGNSPKNLFVQDLAIAFAKRDIGSLLDGVSEEVYWRMVGEKEVRGKDELADLVASRKADEVAKLTVHHVVTHGKAGSVNGTRVFKDGRMDEFCDVYEFTSARGNRVQAITSYVIEGHNK